MNIDIKLYCDLGRRDFNHIKDRYYTILIEQKRKIIWNLYKNEVYEYNKEDPIYKFKKWTNHKKPG